MGYHPANYGDNFSTHILTRRMTIPTIFILYVDKFFNSHPHKEDDVAYFVYTYIITFFNSHPHKEDDSNFKQKHSV